MRRFPLPECRERACAAMEMLGLADKAAVVSANLSHGDQKLLDIGLALVLEPRVLLLDEPTAGMGSEERWQMIEKVRELWKRQNITLVFIEHDMDIVFKIADIDLRPVLRPRPRGRKPGFDPRQSGSHRRLSRHQRGNRARHERPHPCSRRRTSTCSTGRARSCSASASSLPKGRPWRCSAATAPAKARRSRPSPGSPRRAAAASPLPASTPTTASRT